jgi:hypothetical protein
VRQTPRLSAASIQSAQRGLKAPLDFRRAGSLQRNPDEAFLKAQGLAEMTMRLLDLGEDPSEQSRLPPQFRPEERRNLAVEDDAIDPPGIDHAAEPEIGLNADVRRRQQPQPQPAQKLRLDHHRRAGEPRQAERLRLRSFQVVDPGLSDHRRLRLACRIWRALVRSLQCNSCIALASPGGHRSAE